MLWCFFAAVRSGNPPMIERDETARSAKISAEETAAGPSAQPRIVGAESGATPTEGGTRPVPRLRAVVGPVPSEAAPPSAAAGSAGMRGKFSWLQSVEKSQNVEIISARGDGGGQPAIHRPSAGERPKLGLAAGRAKPPAVAF